MFFFRMLPMGSDIHGWQADEQNVLLPVEQRGDLGRSSSPLPYLRPVPTRLLIIVS